MEDIKKNASQEIGEVVDTLEDEIPSKGNYDGLKVSLQVDSADMVNFMLHHNYSGVQGWFGVIISIAALVYLIVDFGQMDWTMRIVMFVIGLLFTVVNPLMLCFKAKKQVATNETFKMPIDYILSDKALVIEQGEEQLVVPWEDLRVIKDSGRSLIVYVTRMRAFIWPKEKLGNQYDDVKKILLEKMGAARVRIKNADK